MGIILRWFVILLLGSYAMTSPRPERINGISLVASRDSISAEDIDPIVAVHANYAAIMPFGFIRDLQHPQIIYNSDRQWFGETKLGVKQYIETLKKSHLKIMMKPQIWVWRGEFTGLIKMKTEAEWLQLEQTYSNFILEYAEIAQDMHTELFCIGTELENFVAYRPEFWKQLIGKIRTVYKGKLTYAANWNEFGKTPFWGQLDYIGIDAYFPVSDKQTPTVQDCKDGWESFKSEIREISEQMKEPVLFTEFGYKSTDFAAMAPWESNRETTNVNLDAQSNAIQALFDEFWDEDWFAGGFVWKWYRDHKKAGGENNARFTPQNKPAEDIVRTYYGMN